jgi:hypothetical protein
MPIRKLSGLILNNNKKNFEIKKNFIEKKNLLAMNKIFVMHKLYTTNHLNKHHLYIGEKKRSLIILDRQA